MGREEKNRRTRLSYLSKVLAYGEEVAPMLPSTPPGPANSPKLRVPKEVPDVTTTVVNSPDCGFFSIWTSH